MDASLLVFMLLALLPTLLVLGCLWLLIYLTKTSKKYQSFILKLKQQGKYAEWAGQHKLLVFLEKLFPWLRFSIILFFVIGFMIEYGSVPSWVHVALNIIGYFYWFVALVVLLMMYNQYKKVPELQSLHKELANTNHTH
jgi:hypothetical protein